MTVFKKLGNSLPGRKHGWLIRKFPSIRYSQIVPILKVSQVWDEKQKRHGSHRVAQLCCIWSNSCADIMVFHQEWLRQTRNLVMWSLGCLNFVSSVAVVSPANSELWSLRITNPIYFSWVEAFCLVFREHLQHEYIKQGPSNFIILRHSSTVWQVLVTTNNKIFSFLLHNSTFLCYGIQYKQLCFVRIFTANRLRTIALEHKIYPLFVSIISSCREERKSLTNAWKEMWGEG